jgi:hypothetical protein
MFSGYYLGCVMAPHIMEMFGMLVASFKEDNNNSDIFSSTNTILRVKKVRAYPC